MGCLNSAPDDSANVNLRDTSAPPAQDRPNTLDPGTLVLYKDPNRRLMDLGTVIQSDGYSYDIRPASGFADSVKVNSIDDVKPCPNGVEFVLQCKSEIMGDGIICVKAEAMEGPSTREISFVDNNFTETVKGKMMCEQGNIRKLKIKLKPPPVGLDQKKYWVLVLLQKDARNFVSPASQPKSHVFACQAIPEALYPEPNMLRYEYPGPKPGKWKGGPLPPGWIQETDPESGNYFFVDTTTGTTQWEPPPVMVTSPAKMKWAQPKDAELEEKGEEVQFEGSDTKTNEYALCNKIVISATGWSQKGTPFVGSWQSARRGLKLKWKNLSGVGAATWNQKISTSLARIPDIVKNPPEIPPPVYAEAPAEQAAAPTGTSMRGQAVAQEVMAGPSTVPQAAPMTGPSTVPQGQAAMTGPSTVPQAAPMTGPSTVPQAAYAQPAYAQPAGGSYTYQPAPGGAYAPVGLPPPYMPYAPQSQPPPYSQNGGLPVFQPPPPNFQPMDRPQEGWGRPGGEPPKRNKSQMKYAALGAVGGAAAVGGGVLLYNEWEEHQREMERRRRERQYGYFESNMFDHRRWSDSDDYWRREAQRAERRRQEAQRQLEQERARNQAIANGEEVPPPVAAPAVGGEMGEYDEEAEEEEDVEEEAAEEEAPAEEEAAPEEAAADAEAAPEEAAADAEAAPEEAAADAEAAPGEEAAPEAEAAPEGNEAAAYMEAGAGPQDPPAPPPPTGGPAVLSDHAQKQDQTQGQEIQVVVKSVEKKKTKREEKAARIKKLMKLNNFGPQSYQQSKAWLKSSKKLPKDAIGICTQLSLDRLPMLKGMCCSWDGYISAAVYITDPDTQIEPLKELFELVESTEDKMLDIHLLYSNEAGDDYYPINNLRNLALREARSEYVFLLDVDFTIAEAMHIRATDEMKRLLNNGTRRALVVPALEPLGVFGRANERLTPQQMQKCIDQGTVQGFHCKHFPAGHGPTDFKRWSKAVAPFQVDYLHCFEPYVVMRKDQVPQYDERFRGYGMNKIAHIAEVESLGTEFFVLPEAFVMAIRHEKSKDWKKTFRDSKKQRLEEMQALFNIKREELKRSKSFKQTKKKVFDRISVATTVVLPFLALTGLGKLTVAAMAAAH